MAEEPDDTLHSIQFYQVYVMQYEKLDEEIDQLIMDNGGTSEKMPAEARDRYRQLARKRDEVLNEMRRLEKRLSLDD
jgi:uncharacterized protein (DUF885 family)